MTNHPIAEQDSLERLIAKLRLSADQGDYGRKPDPTDYRRQAADTLSQMRDALMFARRETFISGSVGVDFNRSARMKKLRDKIDAALTATKIEKAK